MGSRHTQWRHALIIVSLAERINIAHGHNFHTLQTLVFDTDTQIMKIRLLSIYPWMGFQFMQYLLSIGLHRARYLLCPSDIQLVLTILCLLCGHRSAILSSICLTYLSYIFGSCLLQISMSISSTRSSSFQQQLIFKR